MQPETEEEIWKPIPLFAAYEVSNIGRVRRIFTKRWKPTNKILSAGGKSKFAQVSLWLEGYSYNRKVHRLVAEAFLDGYEEGMCVKHKNSVLRDNRVGNLRWDWDTGRNGLPRGVASPTQRLVVRSMTDEVAEEFRRAGRRG